MNILERTGDWTFDKAVAEIFDQHVRKSVPAYNELQNMLGIMSTQILSEGDKICDLGTATGEVILSISNANKSKNIHFTGVDNSRHMIQKAIKRCDKVPNTQFMVEDIESFDFKTYRLITSVFTIQFIPPESRKLMFKKIYDSLLPGGTFILCEKVNNPNEDLNGFFIKTHELWKLNHFTVSEIELKKKSLKNVMRPMAQEYYLNLLSEIGFIKCYPFFRWCNFTGLIATKPL